MLVEQCDNIACFKLVYSANGGTGSGLTSALCERLSDEYGKKYKFATSVYPSPGYSELMVEPYNALLHSTTNLTLCDCVFLCDNEAILNVFDESYRLSHFGFTMPNRVIANAICTQFLTHRYNFIGQQHCHVDDLLINLIPYPRIHFPMVAYAPFITPRQNDFQRNDPHELVRSVFSDSNQLLSVTTNGRAYMSCAMLFSGNVNPIDTLRAIQSIKADRLNPLTFVDWCPTGFKIGLNYAPPVKMNFSSTAFSDICLHMIAGSVAVRDVWTGLGRQFDSLYQKRAFVHWYVAEGLEENEFTMAREVTQQLIEDYEAIARDGVATHLDTQANCSSGRVSTTFARGTSSHPGYGLHNRGMNTHQAATLNDPASLHTIDLEDEPATMDSNQNNSTILRRLKSNNNNKAISNISAQSVNSGKACKWKKRTFGQCVQSKIELEQNQRNLVGKLMKLQQHQSSPHERTKGIIEKRSKHRVLPKPVFGTNCSAAVRHHSKFTTSTSACSRTSSIERSDEEYIEPCSTVSTPNELLTGPQLHSPIPTKRTLRPAPRCKPRRERRLLDTDTSLSENDQLSSVSNTNNNDTAEHVQHSFESLDYRMCNLHLSSTIEVTANTAVADGCHSPLLTSQAAITPLNRSSAINTEYMTSDAFPFETNEAPHIHSSSRLNRERCKKCTRKRAERRPSTERTAISEIVFEAQPNAHDMQPLRHSSTNSMVSNSVWKSEGDRQKTDVTLLSCCSSSDEEHPELTIREDIPASQTSPNQISFSEPSEIEIDIDNSSSSNECAVDNEEEEEEDGEFLFTDGYANVSFI